MLMSKTLNYQFKSLYKAKVKGTGTATQIAKLKKMKEMSNNFCVVLTWMNAL